MAIEVVAVGHIPAHDEQTIGPPRGEHEGLVDAKELDLA